MAHTVDSLLSQYFSNVQILSREFATDINRESVEIVKVRYPNTNSIGYLYFYLNDLNRPLDVLPVIPAAKKASKKRKKKGEEENEDGEGEGEGEGQEGEDEGPKKKTKKRKKKRDEDEEDNDNNNNNDEDEEPKAKKGKKGKKKDDDAEVENMIDIPVSPTSTIQDSEVIQFTASGNRTNEKTGKNGKNGKNDSQMLPIPQISHHRAFEDSTHVADATINRIIDQSYSRLLLYLQNKRSQMTEVDREQFARILALWSHHYPEERDEALELSKSIERHRLKRLERFAKEQEIHFKERKNERTPAVAAEEKPVSSSDESSSSPSSAKA